MKNIHLLPTDKPSILFRNNVNKKLLIDNNGTLKNVLPSGLYHNIYITSNEEIKNGDWCVDTYKLKNNHYPIFRWSDKFRVDAKKIILTTDQDLIRDGVQAIDDEFLKWFINNPNCEKIDLDTFSMGNKILYNVIYSKEKTKQETLEEVSERLAGEYRDVRINPSTKFQIQQLIIKGAKWQAERMYSEEEVGEILYNAFGEYGNHYGIIFDGALINKLFEKSKTNKHERNIN